MKRSKISQMDAESGSDSGLTLQVSAPGSGLQGLRIAPREEYLLLSLIRMAYIWLCF